MSTWRAFDVATRSDAMQCSTHCKHISSLRLSFSTADPQLMDEAIRRLADTIAAAIKNTTSD
ncbi:hypothetical protein ADM96_02100 [Burkholderia sp. ST111]|nr:hypothetical protein ADM96_02100 [Burkholderia sp. ST111]